MEALAEVHAATATDGLFHDIVEDKHAARIQRYLAEATYPWRRIPVVKHTDELGFRGVWKHGTPILVPDSKLHGDWTPAKLSAQFGTATVAAKDDHDMEKTMSLREYLEEFVRLGSGDVQEQSSLRLSVR